MYKAIKIVKGSSGWGGPLIISPNENCDVVLNVTGGGITPLATKIAEMTGARVVDGFKTGCPDEQVCVAVVDCGGTARCGVYPKKGIFTVNLTAVGQSGPLAQFITEDIYVSGVTESCLEYADESEATATPKKTAAAAKSAPVEESTGKSNIITRIGKAVGSAVGKIFQSAREALDNAMRNVIPFMIFISLIVGIITYTGIGDMIARGVAPMVASFPGMLFLSIICAIPFLSPVLGPGAVIAQIIGVLLGTQIGTGAIPVNYALPALFAIDPQVGCDFIPVGLSLGEAEPETVEIGVPAVLFSRLITGPIAVIIAFVVAMIFRIA